MPDKEIPKIRIGDAWVPAHRLWRVVETLTTATDLVERFNQEHDALTTPMTLEVVERVRGRIREMELSMGGEGALHAAAAEAAALSGEPLAQTGGDTEVEAAASHHGSTEVAGSNSSGKNFSAEQLAEAARQLLEAMPLEDALRMLENDYDEEIGIRKLIELVGQEIYLTTLCREAEELRVHQIAADQIAFLWNESGFPSPVDGVWTTEDVQALLGD
jgi:hypothetical protein